MLDNTLYKPVEYNGCKCLVSRKGDVFTIGKGEKFVRREWRYDADGYPVVSAIGYCDTSTYFGCISLGSKSRK